MFQSFFPLCKEAGILFLSGNEANGSSKALHKNASMRLLLWHAMITLFHDSKEWPRAQQLLLLRCDKKLDWLMKQRGENRGVLFMSE